MKVYAAPEGIEVPTTDYSKPYDYEAERQKEKDYIAVVTKWLKENGYDGPHTGGIASYPMGDGYARYIFGDKPRGGVLIHLNFGDGWHDENVTYLPKKAIIENIERGKRMAALFGRKD